MGAMALIKGNILNVFTGEIYPAEIKIESGIISCVNRIKGDFEGIIIPGLIDAHIHIESSMLTPAFFAQAVVPHGTVGVVADPHEIANVMGIEGIDYLIGDSSKVPLRFFYTAPSCVPATPFETSGATISHQKIEALMQKEEIVALGEMMNFPGVIHEDPEVLKKIEIAHKHNKPVDGHAPLLSGVDLCKYTSAGISTDHECSTLEEAREKKELGMKIMIREGSSAQNLESLWKVGGEFLVTDDKDLEDLQKGHMDILIKKSIKLGMDPFKAIQMTTLNPANHYSLPMGAISPGRLADFIKVDTLENFNVQEVYIGGKLVARNGKALFKANSAPLKSSFHFKQKKPSDFNIFSHGSKVRVRVIKVEDGQIITQESQADLAIKEGIIKPDIPSDVLKISLIERYGGNNMSNAFVKGFGIKEGALASSVAHDSHNIVVVGSHGDYMARGVELIRKNGGGLAAISKESEKLFKLPLAGLMTNQPLSTAIFQLKTLHDMVKDMGCILESPFMTMSFLALLVIPELKISDQGLFDGNKFQQVDVIKEIIS